MRMISLALPRPVPLLKQQQRQQRLLTISEVFSYLVPLVVVMLNHINSNNTDVCYRLQTDCIKTCPRIDRVYEILTKKKTMNL